MRTPSVRSRGGSRLSSRGSCKPRKTSGSSRRLPGLHWSYRLRYTEFHSMGGQHEGSPTTSDEVSGLSQVIAVSGVLTVVFAAHFTLAALITVIEVCNVGIILKVDVAECVSCNGM